MKVRIKIFLLSAFFLMVPGMLQASGQTVTLPVEDYRAILQRLDALQQRVDRLEKEKVETRKLSKDIDEIYDTLDKVETKTIEDKLNIGAELRTRMDNFKVRDHRNMITGKEEDLSNDNFWSNRFRLNLSAKVIKGLDFHGRLTVYKNWADSDRYVMYSDPNRAHVPDDTTLKLDRAYIDWVLPHSPVPVALTIGRHPSTEGPPLEFKENRKRQSTYPALLFDGEADGIVMTFGLERYLGLKNSGLRLAYGKGYQSDDDKDIYLDERGGIDDLDVFAAFFETELPRIPGSLLVLSYVRGDNFVDTPLGATRNLGDMDLFGIHVQATNVVDSGLDLFLSWGLNNSHPNGKFAYMSVGKDPSGQAINAPMGLLSSDGEHDRTGWAIYAGLRYTLPMALLNNPKLGFEFNHGSKYWFSFTQGSTEIFNKLASRGDVYDFYYIQPVNRYLFLRTGYTWIDYDYSGSGWHIGQPFRIDDKFSDFYVLIDCRF